MLGHAVERQAGPDLAGGDHPVLGRRRDLQFIVLKWAERSLHMKLDKATSLIGVVAIGVAVARRWRPSFVPLKKSLTVIPLGIIMGMVVMA
jgi:LPLT family lysophospholipid transporter-like MFS transporter